ncbi:MAG TPA: hypothetical protein VGG28_23190 [Kofleriaceae bacterium]|jgi:hypothetical protein
MDEPLEREIERLEHRVPSMAGELVTIRRGLGKRERGIELANVRIASPCKQRWDDMVGDDRVRVCAGCERPVFNLSEMTRADAEAVLATRGLTPCMRFYRRADGTMMTSDCPTRPRGHRLAVAAAGATLALAAPAIADPPQAAPAADGSAGSGTGVTIEQSYQQGIPIPGRTFAAVLAATQIDQVEVVMGAMDVVEVIPRPLVEWSLWGRLGIAITQPPSDVTARSTEPAPMSGATVTLAAAAAADLTLGVAHDGDLRVGAWGELRTTSGPVAGAELVLEGVPPSPAESRISGAGSVVLRAGANPHVITGELGIGYVGAYPSMRRHLRHVVGGRVVVTVDRALDESHDWSATIGVEVEPIGLLHAIYDRVKGD